MYLETPIYLFIYQLLFPSNLFWRQFFRRLNSDAQNSTHIGADYQGRWTPETYQYYRFHPNICCYFFPFFYYFSLHCTEFVAERVDNRRYEHQVVDLPELWSCWVAKIEAKIFFCQKRAGTRNPLFQFIREIFAQPSHFQIEFVKSIKLYNLHLRMLIRLDKPWLMLWITWINNQEG